MYTLSTLIPSVYTIEGQKHSWYRRMSPDTAFLRKNPFSGQVRVENKTIMLPSLMTVCVKIAQARGRKR